MARGLARTFLPTPPPITSLDELAADATGLIESLTGCYLIRLDRIDPPGAGTDVHYDGTLRVSTADALLAVSGDLYVHRASGTAGSREPDPTAGIPIFPRDDYRFYVRGISFRPASGGSPAIDFEFELHAFDRVSGAWEDIGLRRVKLQSVADTDGQPLEGLVLSSSGEPVGRLRATRVSSSLRRAIVEIDRVPKLERPFDNGSGTKWQTVFDLVGWDLTVERGNSNIAEPSGEFWTDAELHQTMLKQRKRENLDSEWRYHLLCVRRIRRTNRGLMYDNASTDSNDVPREGIGIATGWIPEESFWGPLVGRRFGEATASYFRTALHEIGHAMGLQHNDVDFGVMNTTDVLAKRATQPAFPENALWSFAADDRHRLRHLPDPWVRPGGIPFGQSFASAPIADEAAVEAPAGLHLQVEPLLEVVPLGAPVRVEFQLSNHSRRRVEGPASLNVGDGAVRGHVIDPAGVGRAFLPLLRCVDADETRTLKPQETLSHGVTLLRGGDGALFPIPGVHRIVLEVSWRTDRGVVTMSGETSVIVTGPETKEHAVAAHRMLSVPNAMLTLVLGGDHLEDGVSTIRRALDCQQLTEHVAWIEAKRLAVPFFERPARLQEAVDLLDETTVMSQAEIARAAAIVKEARPRVAAASDGAGLADAADDEPSSPEAIACDRLTALLQTKVKEQKVADGVRTEVAAL
ncbi:hypothetical protein ACLQ2Q_15940 [Microbacterium sp. DT81.1]|uniref:hypothetical protein n=1 Tax=Microbacterium sp. DT81.1 TaxID=3393413 RepID=UPI003CF99D14